MLKYQIRPYHAPPLLQNWCNLVLYECCFPDIEEKYFIRIKKFARGRRAHVKFLPSHFVKVLFGREQIP